MFESSHGQATCLCDPSSPEMEHMQASPRDETPAARLMRATRQSSLADALNWIANGYALDGDEQAALRDLTAIGEQEPDRQRAAQMLTRRLSQSKVDSAAVLFRLDSAVPALRYRAALDHLAGLTADKTLRTIVARAVLAAQRDEPFTIEALCAVAGLSYGDLQERASGLPADPRASWDPTQVKAAFSVINDIVTGSVKAELTGAVPMRPLDLMPTLAGDRALTGWALVEDQRTRGVPYEVLLAQRAVGGAWLAHRNTTSSMLNHPLAQRLGETLTARRVRFLRATSVGGDTASSLLQKMAGSDGQIGLLALDDRDQPIYAVAFSSARDSGTASKNANRLRNMRRDPALSMAVVVSGPGWSGRNETADLAMAFDGRLFSDQAIDGLADDIQRTNIARGRADRTGGSTAEGGNR